jgi:predicted MFS family arabinose efflux permease
MTPNGTHTSPLAAPRHLVAPSRVAFWLLGASFLVTMLGNTLPTPLYVLYQEKFGFSTLMITVIFAVYAAGVLVALVLFGRASDQLGRRRVLLPGLACAALSAVAFLVAKGLALLLVGRVLSGLSVGIFVGSATAALVDLAGSGRSRRATLMATASNITGLGLGALLGGVLAQVAPEPLRLVFWGDLGLIALAIAAVWSIPETVAVSEHPRLRISRPDLPRKVRSTFVPAATAGFASFCVGGLFMAVVPSFLANVLHQPSHALAGAMVCGLFVVSTVAQVALAGRFGRWGLPVGCVGLIAGMGLLAAGLAAKSLAIMIAATIVAGLGHGLCFREGLQALTTRAPVGRRAGVDSTYFIVLYIGISLPVIGEGIAAAAIGLQTAGIAFSIAVAAIAAIALTRLVTALEPNPHVLPERA